MKSKILGLLVAAMMASQSAGAVVIVDTGIPTTTSASSVRNLVDATGVYHGWLAGQFVLHDAYAITDFAVWARTVNGGMVTWTLYNDASDLPGQPIWSLNTESVAGAATEWVGAEGFRVELDAGTYWLALEIPDVSLANFLTPIAASPGELPPPRPLANEAGTFYGDTWQTRGARRGWLINGDLLGTTDLPEPGTLALLGLGLAGLGFSRRRKV